MTAIELLVPFLLPLTIIIAAWRLDGRPDIGSAWWFFGSLTAAAVIVGWGISAAVVSLSTTADIASLEAFADSTRAGYEHTIDETNRIVLTDDALTDFSDQAASERIAELRDQVRWYNERLARLNAFNEIPVIRAIVRDPPDRLQPIVLGVEER